MNIYIYTKSGHNVGLDSVRRGAVLYNQFKNYNPILCTSDYRAATFSRTLDVYRGVGIDIIGNLPNLMKRGDILIFDSDEPNETMRKFMNQYCTKLYEFGIDISRTLVSDKFFNKGNKSIRKAFFFGDDDYQNILLDKLCKDQYQLDIDLLMGHYFFLGNDEKLISHFSNVIDEEEYFDTIINTQYLLASSINAVFESCASGNSPVFYIREDKKHENLDLIKKYNIPIIEGDSMQEILKKFNIVIKNYPKIQPFKKVDTSNILDTVIDIMEKNKLLSPSLESNY
ncbi:hypothetical protein MNB_ARC-1_380 [hydrothermal vent metagenome]|uniref:Uncharacterized protein n=1 Tax=hydrothermal vent metagenome TaxID=652676 RepID=A0A3B1E1H4_9ZZZZ